MKQTHQVYLKKWDERIISRRRKYFFEESFSKRWEESFSFKLLWNKFISDVQFVFNQIYTVAKQLKVFGPIIRKEYGLPIYVQCFRLLYLTLVVRKNAQEFRKRLLFKTASWKNVKRYDYGQIDTQLRLATCSFAEEIPVIEDKFRFYIYCDKCRIPTPEITAVFSEGNQIYPINKGFDLPNEDLFIKERKGGKGVRAKNFKFKNDIYIDSDQKKYTKQQVLKFLIVESHRSDLIIQRKLVNHDDLKPFTTGALSTCRIVTVKGGDNGNIKPLFAVMRMPCGNKDVDNYAQGGLLSTIQIESGVLGRAVTYLPYKGKFEFDVHPDTNQLIKGSQVPAWKAMLEFTISSHKQFSSLTVGWDVCYSEKGIFLIEGNIRWGSSLYECPEQKPFRETQYPAVYETLISNYKYDKSE